MSLLDDPALGLKSFTRSPDVQTRRPFSSHIRFRPTSTFARDFGLPPDSEGIVTARYQLGGREVLNVSVDGAGYFTSVPAGEVDEA